MLTYYVEPQVNLSRLKVGDAIYAETDLAVYEFILVDPALRLVRVTSTDDRLKQSQQAEFLRSVRGGQAVVGLIVPAGKMQFQVSSTLYQSGPVVHVTVRGNGYHYDVF
jgi:hypothetical protein